MGKKTNTSLKWCLNYGNMALEDIKDFRVIDYKGSKKDIEHNYITSILSAFEEVKRKKSINRKSNLALYKDIIAHFDEIFVKIKNNELIFNFKNELLKNIFKAIHNNKYFISEILKGETFGHIDKKSYYAKLKTENIVYDIIEKSIS